MNINEAVKLFDQIVRSKCNWDIEIVDINIDEDNKIYIFTRIFEQGCFIKNKQYIIDIKKKDIDGQELLTGRKIDYSCRTGRVTNCYLSEAQRIDIVNEVYSYILNTGLKFNTINDNNRKIAIKLTSSTFNDLPTMNLTYMFSLQDFFSYKDPGIYHYLNESETKSKRHLDFQETYTDAGIPKSVNGYYITLLISFVDGSRSTGYYIAFTPADNPTGQTLIYGVEIDGILGPPN